MSALQYLSKTGLILFVTVCAAEVVNASADSTNQTLTNLNTALRSESNAAHRYELFAIKAEEEGYHQVAKLFRAVSMSESIHLNNHKAAILSMDGTPDAVNFASVNVRTTRENLEGPVKGETFETDVLYPAFIKQAEKDQAPMAATSFDYAQQAEAQHEKLFDSALKELGKNPVSDYCISPISGSTLEVPVGKPCPQEPARRASYIHVR